ncbi:MAG: hypothetical protein SGPRY_004952, partial [Prymnesium sp.]
WHFTIRGPPSTAFEGGRYHGRITLPPEYPFKPPSIALLTPSGRFEAWGIRTIITALIAFFPTKADGALAGLDYSAAERQKLAKASLQWRCGICMSDALPKAGENEESLPPPPSELRFYHAPAPSAAPPSPAAEACSGKSSSHGPSDHVLEATCPTPNGAASSTLEESCGGEGEGSVAGEQPSLKAGQIAAEKEPSMKACEQRAGEPEPRHSAESSGRVHASRTAGTNSLDLLAAAIFVAIVALLTRKLLTEAE